MVIIETIKDCWFTWRTGKDKAQRDWEAWYDSNVNYRANSINHMFANFKHIVVVNPDKFFQFDPFAYVPCEDAKAYMWPARSLGENCVWRIERVFWNPWQSEWIPNDLGDTDKVFVATNSDADATMIALKYS